MPSNGRSHLVPGVPLALASAFLFGASTPFSKLLLSRTDPQMLAGLLYLGAGLGLAVVHLGRNVVGLPRVEAPVRGSDLPWLAIVVFFGGLIGPLLLMLGLARTEAASAALLLNLETLATMAIAWLWFDENVDRHLLLGAIAILAGAIVLSWEGNEIVLDSGAILVAGACLAWGIDNNVTRKLSSSDPVLIAMIKGLASGSVNVVLAILRGAPTPPIAFMAGAEIIGFMGIGVSLVFFVMALRHLGAARTGAYFSLAPFIGALAAISLLREPVTLKLMISACLMGFGLWTHLTERHEHEHVHDALEHEHGHVHDEHHRHEHDGLFIEPHSHGHRHEGLSHAHPHYPDLHHRHLHAATGGLFPVRALSNWRSAAYGAVAVVVAAVLGLAYLPPSPREASGERSDAIVSENQMPAARPPENARASAGANPESARMQEGPIAPASPQGEAMTFPPAGGKGASPLDGVEARLLPFLRGELGAATKAIRFNLDRVRFDIGQTMPRPDSERQLRNLAQILSTYTKPAIVIGHANSRGQLDVAPKVARARLLYIRREFTRMGVNSARLKLKGPFGRAAVAFEQAKQPPPRDAPIFLEIIHP